MVVHRTTLISPRSFSTSYEQSVDNSVQEETYDARELKGNQRGGSVTTEWRCVDRDGNKG
jgi:hypothetical protein